MEINQSVVHEILTAINELAENGDGLTVYDRVKERIDSYVDLVHLLQDLENPNDLHRLKADPDFQLHYGEEVRMNDHIQTILFFSERGLIECENIPESTEAHITHPVVQSFGAINPECFVVDVPDSIETSSDEQISDTFDELADRIITSLAVRQILGTFNFWVDPNIICPTTYLSVHSLSSTVH